MKKYFAFILVSIVLASGCLSFEDNYTKNFAGSKLTFRANIAEAQKVPVLPSEEELRNVLLGPNVRSIKIAYSPHYSTDEAEQKFNGFYSASGFELAFKLVLINKHLYQEDVVDPDVLEVNSTNEIQSSEEIPHVYLMGPDRGAKETNVEVDGYTVIVRGKDFSEVDRKYTDLDLAVDKLLLVLMAS